MNIYDEFRMQSPHKLNKLFIGAFGQTLGVFPPDYVVHGVLGYDFLSSFQQQSWARYTTLIDMQKHD